LIGGDIGHIGYSGVFAVVLASERVCTVLAHGEDVHVQSTAELEEVVVVMRTCRRR